LGVVGGEGGRMLLLGLAFSLFEDVIDGFFDTLVGIFLFKVPNDT
jgi:hypothetical protein